MSNNISKTIISIIFFLWSLIFVLLFQISFKNYLWEVIPEILILVIFVIACLGIGHLTLRVLKVEIGILEKFIFSSSIGMVIIAIFTTLFGFLGLLKIFVFLSFLSLIFLLSIPSLLHFLKEAKERIESIKISASVEFLYFILLCSLLFLVFLFALTPPIFYDSLEFHIAVPNYYILNGKIERMEGNVFSNSPLYLQMIYLFGMIIKNEVLAPVITFFMGVILNLALISFGKRFLFSNYSFLPSLVLISLPLTSFLMTTPIQDLPLALYSFMALFSFLLFRENKKNGWLILTGVFLGFSIGIKYHGLILLLVVPLFIFLLRGNFKENLKFIVVILLLAILVASPWFLKNLFYTGNPFYPLLFKFLGGKGWSEDNNIRYFKDLHIKSPPQMFSLLYHLNISSKIFGAGGIIGPIFLIFLPLYLLGARNKIADALFLVSIISLFPFLATGNIRYSYLSISIFSILISYGINAFKDFNFLRILIFLVLFILLFSNFFISFSHLNLVNPALKLILGEVKKEDYLRIFLPHYRGIEFINNELPSNSLVLFLYEARTAYLKRNFISATPYDDNILKEILRRYKSIEEIINELKSLGITHIFLNEREKERIEGKFDYLGLRDPEVRDRFYSFFSRLKIIYASGSIYIYSLF